jgi:ferredoxin
VWLGQGAMLGAPATAPIGSRPMPRAGPAPGVAAGCARLGLGWESNPLAILSRAYDGRPNCNYCGNCARGCPRRDKGSADITWVRRAEATGRCRIRTGCTVLRIAPGGDDRVPHLIYADAAGSLRRLDTRVLMLRCLQQHPCLRHLPHGDRSADLGG